jgi:hypothetical protein
MADPLPGEILKFQQLPLNNGLIPVPPAAAGAIGAPYPGHDELSTATLVPGSAPIYQGTYMADDFADKFNTPVVHVRWWGSYLQGFLGDPVSPGVKQFLISFETDVPVTDPTNTTGYSHPGTPLLNQIVTKGPLAPGSGTFTEKFVSTPPTPTPLEGLYEYNAELHLGKEFFEHPDTVYWLKIVALVDPQRDGPIMWGWHDRDWAIPDPLASMPPAVSPGEHMAGTVGPIPPLGGTLPVWHFQDDAVQGTVSVFIDPSMPIMPTIEQSIGTPQHYIFPWDGPDAITQFSKDLAFELYTRVPEPGAILLLGLGLLSMLRVNRRPA